MGLELGCVTLKFFQIFTRAIEATGDDVGNEFFLKSHVVVRIVERNLWLTHPEFGQMPASL